MFASKAFAKKITNKNHYKSILCIGSSNSKAAEKNRLNTLVECPKCNEEVKQMDININGHFYMH